MHHSVPQRLPALEYLRGLAMLGVIAIHTGSYSLTNPHTNIHLFALFEIVSRFCVPIFFFISAFGLFLHHDLNKPLPYSRFLMRRSKTVLIPYLLWSFFYMLHYSYVYHDLSIWSPAIFCKFIFFGLASYQLYFLVILFWFYLLFPLWRKLVIIVNKQPLPCLVLLLAVQILFNYYSSYILRPNFSSHFLNLLIENRMSFWVMHYVFIFLLGGICAVRCQEFLSFLRQKKNMLTTAFLLTLAGMLYSYYYLLTARSYGPEQAVNIVHQLSPQGVLYTLAATLFCFAQFDAVHTDSYTAKFFTLLGKHSYFIFLIHPFFMHYLTVLLGKMNLLMTFSITVSFFILATTLSLTTALILEQLSLHSRNNGKLQRFIAAINGR